MWFAVLKEKKWWKLKSCGVFESLHIYYLTWDYCDFLGKGQQALVCSG